MTDLLLLLALSGPAYAAVVQDQAPGAQEAAAVSSEARQRLDSLLPDAASLGASADGAVTIYSPATLYEYIDGAAEGFIAYDFVALDHATYKKGDADVVVDIYDMSRPDNAFGIYSSERSPGSDFIAIGAEAYQAESLLNFVQGQYYVKLSGFSEKQKVAQILERFAREISRRIGADLRLPETVSLFPRSGLKRHSQIFVRQAPLGHEFLSPAYSAKYSFGGKETTLVLSVARNEEEALERVEAFRDQVAKSGEAMSVEAPAGGFKGSSRYEGDVFAFARGVYAVILIAPPEPVAPFIKEIVAALDQTP